MYIYTKTKNDVKEILSNESTNQVSVVTSDNSDDSGEANSNDSRIVLGRPGLSLFSSTPHDDINGKQHIIREKVIFILL